MDEIEIEYLQYVVVPKKPKMSDGKMASQAIHAAFMALENQRKTSVGKELIKKWKKTGQCVIVLECKKPVQLFSLGKYCDQWGVPNHIYIDEGLTEGTIFFPTAFATGIITKDQKWIFQKLKMR